MKKNPFNFSFLDKFKKKKNQIETLSDEIEEDFIEETNENIEDQLNEEVNIIKEELSDNTNKEIHINSDFSEENNDLELPEAPEVAKRFSLKFPLFKKKSSQNFKSKNEGKNKESDLDNTKTKIHRPFQKFQWNDFVLHLFSPYSRDKIHFYFIVFFTMIVAYGIGKNIALFFNQNPPVIKKVAGLSIPNEKIDSSGIEIQKIIATNLFNAKETEMSEIKVEKKNIDSIICTDSHNPTQLDIKLLDTIVLQNSKKSVASLQVQGSSELTNAREGDKISDIAEVSKINRLNVILKNLNTGECEFTGVESEMPQGMPDIKVLSKRAGVALFKSMNPEIKNEGNNFKIKKSFRDRMVTNINEIVTQAKAITITNPDGSMCFKMTEVIKGGVFSMLNIQDDDIICNINGKKIDNLNELMGMLGKIKEIDQFQLGLNRNGMSENMNYSFE